KTSVLIRDGVIEDINRDLNGGDMIIAGKGKVLMPGLINTHTHISMSLLRGYAEDLPLDRWLKEKVWPIERKLTEKLCYVGALLGCLEMIRTGTTCLVDMYYHAGAIAKAVKKAGLRGFIGQGLIDTVSDDRTSDESLRESFLTAAYKTVKIIQELNDSKIKPIVAPHAPYTCSDELLMKSQVMAEEFDTLIHIHLTETRREQAMFQRNYGYSVVEYLDRIGFLNGKVLAAHCVWLTRRDIELLARRCVKISHCPISNMKLGVGGVSPIPELVESGVLITLGTDGPASNNTLDMFETMKIAALLQKHNRWDPSVINAQQILDMATVNASGSLGLGKIVGRVEKGFEADLILVDIRSPSLQPIHSSDSLIANLVYAAKGLSVDTLLVQGKPLMLKGVFQTLDEEEVYGLVEEALEELDIKPSSNS
ncbi:amidohydrolase, partial [Candidatus Bathyarchaeota archaeon]|nr:amidohydrolase [Candidatus Bathyarchaeota archaeon]